VALTGVGVLFFSLATAALAVIPAIIALIPLPSGAEKLLSLVRWPLLFLGAMFCLAVLYRFGPCRENPQWRWLSWGAFVATVLWVIGCTAFGFYARNMTDYGGTYGSLGAIIVTMLWCFITCFCAMLGAEINAEMEHQTLIDTTTGAPEPMGQRGAYVADHIGAAAKRKAPGDDS
jgi:membrane protein